MKKKLLFVLFNGLLFVFSAFATADPIVNGNFETGDLTGWSTISSLSGSADVVFINSSNAVKIIAEQQIRQSFTWAIGDTITFDWAYEYRGNQTSPASADYAYWGVVEGSTHQRQIFNDFDGPDWKSHSLTFTNAGTGLLYFGSENYSGDGDDSIAYFDNIALNGYISTPIPEPATMLLLGTGLVGVAGAARRRKKKQA